MSLTPEERAKAVRLEETVKALANVHDAIVLICSTPTAVVGVPTRMNPSKAALEIAQLRNLLDDLEASIDTNLQKQGQEPGTFIAAARAYLRKVQEETK